MSPRPPFPIPRNSLKLGLLMAATAMVSACASLPSSGPTGSQVQKSAREFTVDGTGIKVVAVQDFAALPSAPARPRVFASDFAPPPTDMIGSGDVLDISVYESGVTLFGGSATRVAANASSQDPTVQVERMAGIRVDDEGYIRLPFIGRLRAAGTTGSELGTKIRNAYRGMSQNPQVLVAIRESIANSVIVGGEVLKPGRLVLNTNREVLSDVVALAGGYRGETKDMVVRVQRYNMNTEFRLGDVLSGPAEDVRIFPGDRISVVRSPRTFSVMGAPGRVEQIPFGTASVSLAEALATAGGSNQSIGDPAAIFVFRFVRNADNVEEPVVYHFNMMNTGSYFLAQRFAMRDKDVLYVGNASANQPSKLVQIISQLFAPIVTVGSLANTLSN